jgi:putative FmdB family regulatory protein
MPTYEYRASDAAKACDSCRELFEVVQAFKDDALAACPDCGAPVGRVISAPTFLSRGMPKQTLSDGQLKKNGFKKFVKEGDGKYRNVLAD